MSVIFYYMPDIVAFTLLILGCVCVYKLVCVCVHTCVHVYAYVYAGMHTLVYMCRSEIHIRYHYQLYFFFFFFSFFTGSHCSPRWLEAYYVE